MYLRESFSFLRDNFYEIIFMWLHETATLFMIVKAQYQSVFNWQFSRYFMITSWNLTKRGISKAP